MHPAKRIDRKAFLTWGIATSSVWALGCSDEPEAPARDDGSMGSSAGTTVGVGGSVSGAGSSGGGAGSGPGGAGGGGGMAAADCTATLRVTITANHDHVLNVTSADVLAGVAKAFDVQGGSEHPHWIELTALDFTRLQGGGTVRKLTCDRGHEHEYIVECVGVSAPTETPSKPSYCDAEHSCGETMGNYCQTLP